MIEFSKAEGNFRTQNAMQLITQLPNIQGFKPLTAAEVKKDVKEITRMLQEDSDSESSVRSEDILPSNYPVKPRKVSRKNGRSYAKDMSAAEYDPKSIEEAFAFLNHIQIRMRPLYEGERIREGLENQHVSVQNALSSKLKDFVKEKTEQENYFRVLQGKLARSSYLYTMRTRQNIMLSDLLVALRRRKEAISSMQAALATQKEMSPVNRNAKNAGGFKDPVAGTSATTRTYPNSTHVLRVQINRLQNEILFYTGMWMATPMGEGVVEAILPLQEKLVIKLPFGVMYSPISRAVQWRSSEDSMDISHSGALCHRWATLPGVLNLSVNMERQIDTLIAEIRGDDEDPDAVATDADVANNEKENGAEDENEQEDDDDESTVTPLDAAETASQMSIEAPEKKSETASASAAATATAAAKKPAGRSARLRGDAPMEVEKAETEKNKENRVDQPTNGEGAVGAVRAPKAGSNEKGTPMFGHPLGAIAHMLEGSASTVAGDLDKSKGGPKERVNIRGLDRLGGSVEKEKAQLKDSNQARGVTAGVRDSLIRKRSRSAFLTPDLLPLMFTPPSSLPAVIEEIREMHAERTEYQVSALDEGKLVGSSSNLGWMDADDLNHMQEVVKGLQDEVKRLEDERRSYMGEIKKKRQRGAEMTTQTAALRLMLFTRRVRRRNNLNTAGYVSPVPPPFMGQKVPDTKGKPLAHSSVLPSGGTSGGPAVAQPPMNVNGKIGGNGSQEDVPSHSNAGEATSSSSSGGQGNGVGFRRNPSRHAATKAAEEAQAQGEVDVAGSKPPEGAPASDAAKSPEEDEEDDEDDGADKGGKAGSTQIGVKGGLMVGNKKKKPRRR